MALIFHQNMLDFGGRNPVRNWSFNIALGQIQAITGPLYWAAGFTEVTNRAAAPAQLAILAQALDAGLTSLVTIEVGTTAVGARREFIGIAWDPAALNVQHAGQVLKDPVTRAWAAHNTAAGAGGIPPMTHIDLPAFGAGFTADSRGLAYIAGLAGGNPYLIAFMHNMYNLGDKTGAYSNLNNMAEMARTAAGGAYANAEVIIGGDFNLEPRNPKRPRGDALTMGCRAARAGGAAVNTTNVHPYDFWLVSNAALTNGDCAVHTQTRSRVLFRSDHAGITIQR